MYIPCGTSHLGVSPQRHDVAYSFQLQARNTKHKHTHVSDSNFAKNECSRLSRESVDNPTCEYEVHT